MFRKKGDVEKLDLSEAGGPEFEGFGVEIQHLGPAKFRAVGFAFQRVSVRHGVDVASLQGAPKTEAELDAMVAHLDVFDQICLDTVVALKGPGLDLAGEEAGRQIVEWGLGAQVGMRALDFQRLRVSEVLS